jgi:ABC-type polysaccharide/polyol phosphate export permease
MLVKLKELYSYRALFFEWTYLQLHQRYQGSVLGFLWTLLYPLLVFLSFSLIFSVLNGWDLKDYGLYFAGGYVAWIFFANATQQAADSIPFNASFVKGVYISKALFPLIALGINMVDLFAGLLIILLLMPLVGVSYSLALFFLPVSILLLVVFVTGTCLLCATANVFLRDFRHLLSSLLFIWFFFSPVLWKSSTLPAWIQPWLYVNPMVPFIKLFQGPIWSGSIPAANDILLASLWAVSALAVGSLTFFAKERKFYFYL